MWTAPHVIRLTTITLRHFGAGERAPSTTSTAAIRRFFNIRRLDRESEEDPHELSGLFPRVIPYTDQTGIILRAQRQRG
jgi:hypothetical protein